MRASSWMAAALALALGAGAVSAAGLTGAAAAHDREQHMKAMGKAAKAIAESLKAGSAAPEVIKPNAAVLVTGSHELLTWFPKGSGQEAEPKSKALPVIWTDWSGFQAKAHDFTVATAGLDAVAGSGDLAKVAGAMKQVGGTCHACHEKFQAKDKD